MVAQVANSDALMVTLPAQRAIAAMGLAWAQQLVAVLFLVTVLLMPAWLPVVATAVAPKPAMRVLSALGAWLRTHERMVNIATGLGIGGIFLLRGLTGLLAAR
jgi:hypothetical protein